MRRRTSSGIRARPIRSPLARPPLLQPAATSSTTAPFTLTYNAPVAFRTGTITAGGADIVFNGGTFNVGNNSNNNAGRNVTIAGSHNVTINSQLTGTPAITTDHAQ